MLADALRDGARYPVIWLAGGVYAALEAVLLWLALAGETFFSTRLLVLEYLLLPFLLAGAYGVLRESDGSPRRLLAEGVKNYFRVLLPALVVAFALGVLLLVLVAPLSAVGGAVDLIAVAAIAVVVPVAILLSLYDTAACFEGLGVFASLRRSASLVLAHLGAVMLFLVTTIAVLGLLGLALAVAWTAALFPRLEPLATMPASEVAALGQAGFAEMIGSGGTALAAACYAIFVLAAFVLVTTYKARIFRSVAESTPTEQVGVYDEKGRWYRY